MRGVDKLAYGFKYRGRHSSEFGVNLLTYVIHPPEIREYEEEIAGLAGVIDYGTEFGKRQIDLTIDITPDTRTFKVRQSEIYNWLKPTLEPGPLIFDEIPDRVFYAKLTGQLGMEQFNRYGTFELTMKCTDPYIYGPEDVQQLTITSSPTSITVSSAGMEPTPPVIELVNNGTGTIGEITLSIEYPVD